MQSRDAASLDPLAGQISTTIERISMVYPALVIYDTDNPNDPSTATRPKPGWATERWEFSGDGKTLTFHLKKGLKYTNTPPVNGRELVSEDVKFSILRYMTHPTSTFKPRYDDIASIDTPDKYTVVFNLKRPSAYILYALAAEPSYITPPEIEKQYGDYKQVLVGPGPFIHEKTIQGEGSFFTRNPDYYDAGHIYLDRVIFKVVTDNATRTAAMRAGQAHWGQSADTKSGLDAILKTNPDMKYETQNTSNFGVWYNMKNPLFQDLRVRKGLSKGVDLQEVSDRIYEGDGSWQTVVPVGFGKWALPQEEVKRFDAYIFDPKAGKKLLDEAGFKVKTIKMYLAPKNINALGDQIMGIFAPVWEKEYGIKLDISTDEYSTFVNKCYNNKFDDVCVFGMGLYDPIDYARAQYYTAGPRNGPGLDDPKVNAMLDDIVSTLDEGQRLKKLLDFQRHVSNNILSMLHIPRAPSYRLYQPFLRNFVPALRMRGAEWIMYTWIDK